MRKGPFMSLGHLGRGRRVSSSPPWRCLLGKSPPKKAFVLAADRFGILDSPSTRANPCFGSEVPSSSRRPTDRPPPRGETFGAKVAQEFGGPLLIPILLPKSHYRLARVSSRAFGQLHGESLSAERRSWMEECKQCPLFLLCICRTPSKRNKAPAGCIRSSSFVSCRS